MQTLTQARPGTSHQWDTPDPQTHRGPTPQTQRRRSKLAKTSLALALWALAFSWIPLLNLLSIGLATLAVLLGTRAFKQCNQTRHLDGFAPAITGTVIGAATISLSLAITITFLTIWAGL